MAITDQSGGVYQYAGVNYCSAGENGLNKPKKGPKPKILFAYSTRYNDPTFNEKKFLLNIPYDFVLNNNNML